MPKASLVEKYLDALKTTLLTITFVSDEALNYFTKKLILRSYKKNEIYIRKNEVVNKLAYIISGAARIFFELKEKDNTMFFIFEGSLLTVLDSLTLNTPSNYSVEFIEDTKLFEINKADMEDVLIKYPIFEKVGRLLIEKLIIDLYQLQILQKLSSKEKYKKILDLEPHLILRTKNKHLCSYLNITEQSLSRLKSEIKN